MTHLYMLGHTVERHRWVGPVEDENDWARHLSRIQAGAVSSTWDPVEIEWLPETIRRDISDFPYFWSSILCMSQRARRILEPILGPAGEFLELNGLDGEYSAFHCLETRAVVDQDATARLLSARPGIAFASPNFVPALNPSSLGAFDVFRTPDSFQKVYVTARVKHQYSTAGLTGLTFLPVPVAGNLAPA